MPFWGDVGLAFLGGGAALFLERLWERWGHTSDARELADALRLELEGHMFRPNPSGVVACDKFRSTVFDHRYGEIASLLPDDLVSELNGYYGDLSHAWQLFVDQRTPWSMMQTYVGKAPERRTALLDKLKRLAGQSRVRRFLRSGG